MPYLAGAALKNIKLSGNSQRVARHFTTHRLAANAVRVRSGSMHRIGRGGMSALSPFYPQLRTLVGAAGTAASCHFRTHAPQQNAFSIWMFCPIARDRFLHVGDVTDW